MSRAVYEDDVIKLLNRGLTSGMYPLACDVRALPSAQPERPNGHWIFDFAHNEMTCSECGRTFTGGFDLENADNFCRHCGSDNRGEQDE